MNIYSDEDRAALKAVCSDDECLQWWRLCAVTMNLYEDCSNEPLYWWRLQWWWIFTVMKAVCSDEPLQWWSPCSGDETFIVMNTAVVMNVYTDEDCSDGTFSLMRAAVIVNGQWWWKFTLMKNVPWWKFMFMETAVMNVYSEDCSDDICWWRQMLKLMKNVQQWWMLTVMMN